MKKTVRTLAVLAVIFGISLHGATAQQQTKIALFNYEEVAATMPEYKDVMADYKIMEEIGQELWERYQENENKLSNTRKHPDVIKLLLIEQDELKKRLKQHAQTVPNSKKLLDEKIGQHQSSIHSKYNVLCLTSVDFYYYSSDIPDVTQWFAESIAGKTTTAPNIGNAPQKIGVVNGEKVGELLQKHLSDISDKLDANQLNIEEAQKIHKEIQEKPFQIISALGEEGNFTLIIDAGYMQYLSNPNQIIDLTDSVLARMK